MSRLLREGEDRALVQLAQAYDGYKQSEWRYGVGVDGAFLVDRLFEDESLFKRIAIKVGLALLKNENDPYAQKVCLLFDRLYKHGFSDGSFKEEFQGVIHKCIPERSIPLLEKKDGMQKCMETIAGYAAEMADEASEQEVGNKEFKKPHS